MPKIAHFALYVPNDRRIHTNTRTHAYAAHVCLRACDALYRIEGEPNRRARQRARFRMSADAFVRRHIHWIVFVLDDCRLLNFPSQELKMYSNKSILLYTCAISERATCGGYQLLFCSALSMVNRTRSRAARQHIGLRKRRVFAQRKWKTLLLLVFALSKY